LPSNKHNTTVCMVVTIAITPLSTVCITCLCEHNICQNTDIAQEQLQQLLSRIVGQCLSCLVLASVHVLRLQPQSRCCHCCLIQSSHRTVCTTCLSHGCQDLLCMDSLQAHSSGCLYFFVQHASKVTNCSHWADRQLHPATIQLCMGTSGASQHTQILV